MNRSGRTYRMLLTASVVAMTVMSGAATAAAASAKTTEASLRNRLPKQSLVYIEYAGCANIHDAVMTTPLGKAFEDEKAAELPKQMWRNARALIMREVGDDADEQKTAAALLDLAEVVGKQGFALDVIDFAMTPQGPDVSAVLIVPAGDAAKQVADHLTVALDEAGAAEVVEATVAGMSMRQIPPSPDLPFPITYGAVDDVFVAAIGASTIEQILPTLRGEGETLASNATLSKSLSAINGADERTDVFLLFVDLEAIMQRGQNIFLAMNGMQEMPPSMAQMKAELGLDELRVLTATMQIADGGYRTSFHLDAGQSGKGLGAILKQKPLTEKDLLWLPKNPSMAMAANFDLLATWTEIKRLAGTVFPPAVMMIESQLGQIKGNLEVDIEKDIIGALGDSWAIFDAPEQGGFLFTGFVFVAEANDAARFQNAVKRLAPILFKELDEEVFTEARFVETKVEGTPLTYLQFAGPMPVAPCWAEYDGRLVMGLTPQQVRPVLRRMKADDAKQQSILANTEFQKLRKLLPDDLSMVRYNDSRAAFTDYYWLFNLGGMAACNGLTTAGESLNATAWPDAGLFLENMTATVGGATYGEHGLLVVSQQPLPIDLPSMGGPSAVMAATSVSVLMPSLARARAEAKRVGSAANMRAIGQASMTYAMEHDGALPDDLDALLEIGLTEEVYQSPRDYRGDVRSYTYIAGLDMDDPINSVVAYEDFPGREEGGNVLFLDGHVEFIRPVWRIEELAQETREYLAKKQQGGAAE